MSTFTLEIATGNAAFEDEPVTEIARILRETADKLERGDLEMKLYDINGNFVGWAKCRE